MNVLNVEAIERELFRCACYARNPAAQHWVQAVARNHILSTISLKDRDANFIVYTGVRNPCYIDMMLFDKLPDWARTAFERGEVLYWFDTVQVRRRTLWQAIEQIVHWFNNWPAEDKRWNRVTRINFETAASAAAMWFSNVQSNLWDYVKDQPPIVYKFNNGSGFHWVKMVTPLHFERESRLMSHCVGNGVYYNSYKSGHNEYYSLRDKNNLPHATMEVSTDTGYPASEKRLPCMSQVKGKGNAKPDSRYQPYVYSFVTAQRWPINGDREYIDKTCLIEGEFCKRH